MRYPEPTVGAIIFNPDNKILLCKSHKWNNKYIIPGGHIELGTKMEAALKREILVLNLKHNYFKIYISI